MSPNAFSHIPRGLPTDSLEGHSFTSMSRRGQRDRWKKAGGYADADASVRCVKQGIKKCHPTLLRERCS